MQGIRDSVLKARPLAEISTEYLDAKRFGRQFFGKKAALLEGKYRALTPDLVFLCDDDALAFQLEYGARIWPAAPVVFCGINDHSVVPTLPRDRMTGITETFSIDPFLEVARRAHRAERCFVLTDNTTTGLALRDAMRQYAARHPRLRYVFLDGSKNDLPQLLAGLGEARAEDLVVASMFTADSTRSDYLAPETQTLIASASVAPVVSPTTSDLGGGYLAGRLNNGRSHGEFAASLGLKILEGKKPAEIPVVEHDIIGLVVDHRVAEMKGIPDRVWPADTVFVNRPEPRFGADRPLVAIGLLFMLAQTGIIAALAFNTARRRKAELALRYSEESLERAQEIAKVGSWVRKVDTGALSWSRQVYRIYGLEPGSITPSMDYLLSRIHPEDRDRIRQLIERNDEQGADRSMEYRIIREDGSERHLSVKGQFRRLPDGNLVLDGTVQDITEIREMEAQVRQVQEMESVGQLAGGIAHDFNNLLTVINGYSQLLLRRMDDGNAERHRVEEILRAGERAAVLTRQLLAFSRRQVMHSVSLDLPATIQSMAVMLQTVLGETIQLQLHFSDPAPVKVDPSQLEQVVLNLVLNARDAMPDGGRVTITAQTARLESDKLRSWGVPPGDYTLLTVADTGMGMDEATQARIFEPFYTTKPTGKGTGLGLSTVYGIVKQSGGHIALWSRPGLGTEFRIYLPVANEPGAAVPDQTERDPAPVPDGGTVLLVEDQDAVRQLASETLSGLGYHVLEAGSGEAALQVAAAHNERIGLLITDVVMPGITGPELAVELRRREPGLRVLFITGYAGDALESGKDHLLPKPFLPSELAWKVRETMAQERV